MFSAEFLIHLQNKDEAKLIEYIQLAPEFGIFRDEKGYRLGTQTSGSSRSGQYCIEFLAKWLIYRLEEVGQELMLEQLSMFLKNPEPIPVVQVLAINGVIVEEAIQLSEDVSLVPYKDLPNSQTKAQYNPAFLPTTFLRKLYPGATNLFAAFREFTFWPQEAIEKHPLMCLYHTLEPYGKDIQIPTAALLSKNSFDEMIDAYWCLKLLKNCSTMQIARWCDAEEWVPYFSLYAGSGSSRPLYDDVNRMSKTLINEDKEKLKRIYLSFRKLSIEVKRKLHVPLERINRAIRKFELENKLIDLGIASESLFLDAEDKTELTYKLKHRAALFLGESFDERQEIAGLFSRLYDYRSQAVHRGEIKDKVRKSSTKRQSLKQDIEKGIFMLQKAIEQIIVNGDFPNWEKVTFLSRT